MILPAQWQETIGLSQSRVIGDADQKGQSTFRRDNNRDIINLARLDLAYGWTARYQTGVSVKYQNRTMDQNGTNSSASGWNDVGLSQAYKPFEFDRLWFFQTLNIPTATSQYNANSSLAADARGTGTYLTSVGVFGIHNFHEWDIIYSGEVHRSFGRTFNNNGIKTEVGSFWGSSVTAGAGYIPWRSKSRYGFALTPRLEGGKDTTVNGSRTIGRESLVWDTSINYSYTINALYALGLNYTDQTILGPVKNTKLNRSVSYQFQIRWL